jgi:hypothetical protein
MKKIKRNLNRKYQRILVGLDNYIKWGSELSTLISYCQGMNKFPKAVKCINQYFQNKPFSVFYDERIDESFEDAMICQRRTNNRISMKKRFYYKNYDRYGNYIKFNIVEECMGRTYQFQRKSELRIYKDRYEVIPLTKWNYVGTHTMWWAEME